MPEINEIRLLIAHIKNLVIQISELKEKLKKNINMKISDNEKSIILSYYLTGIYSLYEDIFEKVTETFENTINSKDKWHQELLTRMVISVKDVRPNLISKNNFEIFNELRKFRHVFRYSYVFTLKLDRIMELTKNYFKKQKNINKDINQFLKFLVKLTKE